VRISVLEPFKIQAVRDRVAASKLAWQDVIEGQAALPGRPDGMTTEEWSGIVEHVARAERVSQSVRQNGLEHAVAEYGDSEHAIEVATVVAASVETDAITLELLESLFMCDVDELVAYGTFLTLLVETAGKKYPSRVLRLYERFCESACRTAPIYPEWADRLGAIRDGLASFYVSCGKHEQGHDLFRQRHKEERSDLVVALAASRAYLSAGAVSRAIQWLGMGAERATELGRGDMADRLREKQLSLRKRLS
jgi:hypothetical protein